MNKICSNSSLRRFRVFILFGCLLVMLSGCGSDETEAQVQSAVQTAEGTRNGAAQTSEETQDGAAQTSEEVQDGAAQISEEAQEDVAQIADDTNGNGQLPQENVTVELDETSADRAQMEIDEETRKELTTQLLEENHLDTSVVEPKRATRGCTFDLPEGFAESEEVPGMYVKERYPLDASTISYAVLEQDMALQLLTKEAFQEQTQESLRQAYGDDVEVAIDSFESIEVSGYPAFRIKCSYQVERIKITQLAYIINADKTYAVTYSQTSDYDYMEEYEASAATIRVQ